MLVRARRGGSAWTDNYWMTRMARLQLAVQTLAVVALWPALPRGAHAQVAPQTDADHYTRYELLAPGSAKFKIIYEVTATTAGATKYFNPIRKGSIATDEAVYDRMNGKPLHFDVVPGSVARAGGVTGADSGTNYIQVDLPRPVPNDGEVRLRIDKTYEDARSYVAGGDTIVYTRPLGIRKNAIVLPVGFELTSVNYPSQVRTEEDGRVVVSFINTGVGEVPYVVKGRRVKWQVGGPPHRESGAEGTTTPHQNSATQSPPPQRIAPRTSTPASPASGATPRSAASLPSLADVLGDSRFSERAHQDREIVYFLQPPETNSFDLYHDYTESRAGIDKYLNVVRAGSKASRPSARILDTGEELHPRTLRGAEITQAKLDIGEPITKSSEVVVIPFAPVRRGESIRLRISETYTDPARYRVIDGTLVWDRAFGRPANALVLPPGWALTNCSVPATISLTADGRVRLEFTNQRNDEVSVLLTAARRE